MYKVMLALGILCSFFASSVCADSSLFADDSIDEIGIEIDPDFEDDFAHIEEDAGHGGGAFVTDSYERFSASDIMRSEKSLSIFGGNETIDAKYYLLLYPQGHFKVWRMDGHLGVPLRFSVYDNYTRQGPGERIKGFVDGKTFITPRPEDFRNFYDLQRGIRYVAINKPKDPYFARLSRSHSLTMGQGELVSGMMPDGLYDYDPLFFSGHLYFDPVHVDAFVGPLLKASIAGISTRFMPLKGLLVPSFVQNTNFDVGYVGDFAAPNQPYREHNGFVLDDEKRAIKRHTGTAQGLVVGAATEFYPINWLRLKPYISYGHLWLTGMKNEQQDLSLSYGAGLHVGHELSFDFLSNNRSVLLLKTEARLFSKNYMPGYFGSSYLIDRALFIENGQASVNNPPLTKSQWLHQGDDQKFRVGYLFALGYVYDEMVSTMLSYENAHSFADGGSIPQMRKLQWITSVLGLEFAKLHLGYQVTSLKQFKEVFDFNKSRALVSLRGQIKLLPFLYFDAWAKHSFGIHDMFAMPNTENESDPIWLSGLAESKSFNFGLGLEFAMTF